jgi:peptide chain release factor 2
MNKREIQSELGKLKANLATLERAMGIAEAKDKVAEYGRLQEAPDFWNDAERARQVSQEHSRLSQRVEAYQRVLQEAVDLEEFLAIVGDEDAALIREMEEKLAVLRNDANELELQRMLCGENDRNNAIVSLNAGAGGTEAQDWCEMLLRMYLRYAERKGYQTELIEATAGEEAGLKGATFIASGAFAYGYLKAEAGVHRLVRISPFDANKRRHTSFASVYVSPELDDSINLEVEEKDIRIDTYRAGGAGGQHVNKTDSAVRITHFPTGIVVQCQNERSQHKNKAMAFKVLRSRLYELEMRKRQEAADKERSQKKKIEWGSQIRSYVLQPYQMVKDHRTDFEMGNVTAVLDGALDGFIRAFLLSS